MTGVNEFVFLGSLVSAPLVYFAGLRWTGVVIAALVVVPILAWWAYLVYAWGVGGDWPAIFAIGHGNTLVMLVIAGVFLVGATPGLVLGGLGRRYRARRQGVVQ